MSSRERVGERDREGGGGVGGGYRSGYNARGGGGNFRGRGGPGGYKPPVRRYWDNDEYYKEDRERGGRRRRRSYSRSRSRSYSSRSRSRSRSPPARRGRSRSPRQPEEYIPQATEPSISTSHNVNQTPEPYIPSSDPANSWTASTLTMTLPQANGQSMNQINPYADSMPTYHTPQYQEHQGPLSSNNQAAMSYGYTRNAAPPVAQYQRPPVSAPPAEVMYPQPTAVGLAAVIPPPPVISEPKVAQVSNEGSKKNKKDKRKKKKRHHSSSSSSSSSDEDDSSESRRRNKSKKDRRNSDSSSEEDKKETRPPSSVLTSQQKEALAKQRDGYKAKLEILEREIEKLQNKEDELVRNRADRQLIGENLKLQAELKGRCKAVLIVLEKIDDVFKDGNKSTSAVEEKPKPVAIAPIIPSVSVPTPAAPKHAPPNFEPKGFASDVGKGGFTAFEYFDNRQHWCRLCSVFPESVEEMLSHFHSKEHHDQIQQLGIDEKPWHKRNAASDSKHVSGARKAPFRGMQFFSPVQGWYCRLCDFMRMGDPHCAVEHLKSDEHNSNYMSFLEEHPDWEKKWVSDREKALGTSGTQDPSHSSRKSRFDDSRQPDRPEKKSNIQENMESGKSIRVQMRNSLKSEEKDHGSPYAPAAVEENKPNKDSGLEEWMSKPKIPVDIIDTQKFAAIVRQKHGAKEKETRDTKHDILEVKLVPAAPVISAIKDGRDSRRDDKRKVELQISNRDKDRDIRDRYNRDNRERETRGSRRRSRSRSRSRDRGRYNRRRSRSRSRSRSRERPDRDVRDRDRRDNRGGERERPEIKEAVKKLPMIGKMPLYKRPIFPKDKTGPEETKDLTAGIPPVAVAPVGLLHKDSFTHRQKEETRVSLFSDNSTSNPPYSFEAHTAYSQNDSVGEYGTTTQFGNLRSETVPVQEESPSSDIQHHVEDSLPSGDGKEKEETAPAALPDDFQQALDIIYAANSGGNMQPKGRTTVPQPVPPPAPVSESESSTIVMSDKDEPLAPGVSEYGSTDYEAMGSNGYGNYMGYQPYQQSFDGYAPYEELDDGPPGVGDAPPGTVPPTKPRPTLVETPRQDKVEVKDPPPPGDDDMDDLRMLGIDVDDAAVVKH